MNRGTIKTLLRTLLGTTSDDPKFGATTLDPIVQQAVDSIVTDIVQANPSWLSKQVTLLANGGVGHTYTLTTQAVPILDFSRWLEVRYTDENGAKFTHARLEELNEKGSGYFDIVGPDDAPDLITSPSTSDAAPIWMRYAYWAAELASDSSVPTAVPGRFHDVVALEALFVYGLGGEEARTPEMRERWQDRRAQLIAHCGRRGVEPNRTRLYGDAGREC